MDKRVVAVTLKLTDEEEKLFRRAGELLYGKDHPVRAGVVIRELAKRGAKQVLKKNSSK